MSFKPFFTFFALAALPLSAGAADAGWTGEASLTGSRTTGNTETTDIGLGLNLTNETDDWRQNFRATADFGRVSGANSRERYVLAYQLNHDFSDHIYFYGNSDYFNDQFGAFAEGYFIGGGAGYKIVESDPLSWDVEGGVGFRSQTSQGPLSLTEDELALRGASQLKYDLNENVSAYNNSEIQDGESNTYLWNELGLTATLAGNLAARASFRIDHNTVVPQDREPTDTVTRFGIVYTMK